MPLDSSKHFDAPRSPSTVAAAVRLARTHAGAIVALVLVATIVLATGALLLFVDRATGIALDASIRATTVAVVLDPATSAADVAAVGRAVGALPQVERVDFRPKDEALRSLVSRGVPAADGRNPLPDLWIARLRPEAAPDAAVAAIRQGAQATARGASVDVDERWIATLERARAARTTLRVPAIATAFALLAAVLASAAFLAGRLLSRGDPGKPALALVAGVAVFAASLAAVAVVAAAAAAGNAMGSSAVEVTSLSAGDPARLGLLAVGGMAVAIAAIAVGARPGDKF